LGAALLEHTVTDHRDGRIVNASLADYLLPVNADVPELRAIYLDRADTHLTPIGVKGLREVVIVGVAPAIANGVFHATGRHIRELPITPQGPSLKQGRRRDLSHRGGGPSHRPAGAPSSDFAACVVCACIAGDVVLDLSACFRTSKDQLSAHI